MNKWEYRVVRKESKDGSDEWYSIQEVYYDDETGKPMAYTTDLQVEGDTVTEMRTVLESMLNSLEEPVLDESDIVDNKNNWVCEICGESTKDVEYDYLSGTYHLKCVLVLEDEDCGTQRLVKRKVDKMEDGHGNKVYIYESPDGGATIYRREFGDYDTPREEVGVKGKIKKNMDKLRGL